ncbi:MAG: glutamate synthase large subunit [Candidatus Omnitrophica bacterium]|nr:glutamate synthase large subunit [Candidatus Omnitrophota bacterium]
MESTMKPYGFPARQGLYDYSFERDSCGVGFVCDVQGRRSHKIIEDGLEVLRRLSHRGATGADPKTGDGAGILLQIPHEFLLEECQKNKINLPENAEYGTGLVFLPRSKEKREFCKQVFASVVKETGATLLGWRKVPIDDTNIGKIAKNTQPVIEQVFIAKNTIDKQNKKDPLVFERRLYLIRKKIEKLLTGKLPEDECFYITNLSSRTLCYKGLLMPHQLEDYFPDLKDKRITSALVVVHSRYSTNTFPSWDRAQPMRFLAHNGEINTLRGNINWMHSREGQLSSSYFGKDIEWLKPVIVPGGSDSAALDNVLELLVLNGRSLAHALMMLVPAAWEKMHDMPEQIRHFYRYHACIAEPWDGPAALVVTDGVNIASALDRNGLRPCRYIQTKDNHVIMASEVGVIDVPPRDILTSGRLEPGKIFFIDTQKKRIIEDNELKSIIAAKRPYGQWCAKYLINLKQVPYLSQDEKPKEVEIGKLLKTFGYTREELRLILKPMVETAQEPVGSMGDDTPCAVLSKKPQLLYSYFKQLFAQVTNPAIDHIREEIVMSLATYLGPEGNFLEEDANNCHKLFVEEPILTNSELEKIRNIKINSFKTKTISLLFDNSDKDNFLNALEGICQQAEKAIEEGYSFIILSDRGINEQKAALSALLACGAVHHYLIEKCLRTRIGIIIESGEPRQTHHIALLFGYGADCVNPYLAYEVAKLMAQEETLNISEEQAIANYRKALHKGLQKILSKMGISTLQSYRGAQIFEALGLHQQVIERCFRGTVSRLSGADFTVLCQETLLRHTEAFSKESPQKEENILPTGGYYHYRRDGEYHLWNPDTITLLHEAVRKNSLEKYKAFAQLVNNQATQPVTLRSLFDFKTSQPPVPIEEVEPFEKIITRFYSGAMSFGSISGACHRTIAIAMNRMKAHSNSGEGGEDPARFHPLPNGDSLCSAVKQVASGRFGVTCNYLVNAEEIQIKICQGAKPGEGGQLPGHKVSAVIAATRYTTPGVTLISPPPHHDIYSIEDLAQLIFDLKNVNPCARISVKLVSEVGVGTVAAGVAKAHADMILISGGEGGTGASPWSSIKHAGLPWELGLSETHQTLILNNLRSRVRLQVDGGLRTGRDVAIACLLGAEEFGFASAVLVCLGCVMLRHCNLNTCAVGIATQEEVLEKKFAGRPEHLINYFHFIVEELRAIMAELGFRTIDEMVGRSDMLVVNKDRLPWKAKNLDLSTILYQPPVAEKETVYCSIAQQHNLEKVLDKTIIENVKEQLEKKSQVQISLPIDNSQRAVGAMLSGYLCKRFGEYGLSDDTIHCKFYGVAGQSFGAFLCPGVVFELEGMANDYVGKGLSGGRIIIYPGKEVTYQAHKNIIIGNTTFYGATSGEAYIRGCAGERFAIRNSGMLAVVEGVGDHGCEYMTGGRVIILGKTGRNFAAGMSGGIAYVYDPENKFRNFCNFEMVNLEKIDITDQSLLQRLLSNHYRYTQSSLARKILDNFSVEKDYFVKVMPLEYKRILESQKTEAALIEQTEG